MGGEDDRIIIAGAARTPVGFFNGSLSALLAHELGQTAIRAALERAQVKTGEVSEIILGQILSARQRSEPRTLSINCGRHPRLGASLGA